MVFVTHDQDEALSIADRVAVMSGGRIEQFADPETLYARPETSFVAGFVGSMNFLEGAWTDGFSVGDGEVPVPCGRGCFAGLSVTDGNWEIAVRPEDVIVEHAWETGPATGAAVLKQVAHGHFREVVLSLGGSGVEVRAYVNPGFDLSGPVTVRLTGPPLPGGSTASRVQRGAGGCDNWFSRARQRRRRRCQVTIAIAHRGEPANNRENTFPSFLAAVSLGADMVSSIAELPGTSEWWSCTTRPLSACGT